MVDLQYTNVPAIHNPQPSCYSHVNMDSQRIVGLNASYISLTIRPGVYTDVCQKKEKQRRRKTIYRKEKFKAEIEKNKINKFFFKKGKKEKKTLCILPQRNKPLDNR